MCCLEYPQHDEVAVRQSGPTKWVHQLVETLVAVKEIPQQLRPPCLDIDVHQGVVELEDVRLRNEVGVPRQGRHTRCWVHGYGHPPKATKGQVVVDPRELIYRSRLQMLQLEGHQLFARREPMVTPFEQHRQLRIAVGGHMTVLLARRQRRHVVPRGGTHPDAAEHGRTDVNQPTHECTPPLERTPSRNDALNAQCPLIPLEQVLFQICGATLFQDSYDVQVDVKVHKRFAAFTDRANQVTEPFNGTGPGEIYLFEVRDHLVQKEPHTPLLLIQPGKSIADVVVHFGWSQSTLHIRHDSSVAKGFVLVKDQECSKTKKDRSVKDLSSRAASRDL
jgi:hypothetical protein